MTKRRELTLAQREAKKEHDRQRRFKEKMEVKRMGQVEADFEVLRNAYGEIKEDYERLNSKLSQLMDTIRQLRQQNSQLQEALNQEVDSWVDYDKFPSPNEEVASDYPITQCPGSSQSAIHSNRQQQTKPSQ